MYPSVSDARQTLGAGTRNVPGDVWVRMRAKREFRDRPETEVAVLDALVDRGGDGMTVLELRAAVDADIDSLEDALGALKEDGLISVDELGNHVRIKPAERVVPDPTDGAGEDRGFVDIIREKLGL